MVISLRPKAIKEPNQSLAYCFDAIAARSLQKLRCIFADAAPPPNPNAVVYGLLPRSTLDPGSVDPKPKQQARPSDSSRKADRQSLSQDRSRSHPKHLGFMGRKFYSPVFPIPPARLRSASVKPSQRLKVPNAWQEVSDRVSLALETCGPSEDPEPRRPEVRKSSTPHTASRP